MSRKLIVIGGATASGKTSLSVELAKRLNGEIISCDSMQIYKGLDIGTSKVKNEEMQGIKHHMLSIIEPTVNYSVSDYVEEASRIIVELFEKNIQPIVVGGTGFYITSLLYKKSLGNVECNEEIRKKYTLLAEKEGNITVYNELLKVDRLTAEKLSPNDLKRVIRALEIFETTGRPKSLQNDVEKRYDYKAYCIDMPRAELYSRIDERVEEMVNEGLFEEVKNLLNVLEKGSTALSAIGYKEIVEYFEGKVSREKAIDNVKLNTRHYAKRQITYFKHQLNCTYIDGSISLNDKVNAILNDYYSE